MHWFFQYWDDKPALAANRPSNVLWRYRWIPTTWTSRTVVSYKSGWGAEIVASPVREELTSPIREGMVFSIPGGTAFPIREGMASTIWGRTPSTMWERIASPILREGAPSPIIREGAPSPIIWEGPPSIMQDGVAPPQPRRRGGVPYKRGDNGRLTSNQCKFDGKGGILIRHATWAASLHFIKLRGEGAQRRIPREKSVSINVWRSEVYDISTRCT